MCKKLGLSALPNHCKTHDLSEIVIFSGFYEHLATTDGIRQSWDLLVKFSKQRLNNLRYEPNSKLSAAERDELIKALDDPTEGIWTWLSSQP